MRETTGNNGDGTARGAGFPIVALGASAGGLEALRQVFSHLPADTGMAFVVIQHLDPDRPSLLSDLLAGDVRMPVAEVANGMRVEPNRVYVIPSGADLGIRQGCLTLAPRPQTRKPHLPIDSFFRELAAESSGQAIGVVLSGSASDGTEGLRAIKAAGGITFAQEPASAQFKSMPESAIAAGVVDFRAAPETIASELIRLSEHPYLAPSGGVEASADEAPADDEDSLARVFAAMRQHARLDFRGYKRPTLMRRIARRMALRRLGSLREYAESLADDAGECNALAQDILIHVTSFFRDPAAFEALKQCVLPELLARKDADASLRVWVPGCSTGDEVYSLAICLVEFLAEQRRDVAIKIFGSDLGERAIETARAGRYSESDLEGVSPERLARFFERTEGRFRIRKQIRDLCVFVQHDLTRDPPFAKLDIVSCRNVLIYFGAELQRRVVPLLHRCLTKPGYLLLGSSEGIREFGDLFAPVDKQHRIFRKTGESPRIEYPMALARETESKLPAFQAAQRPQPARDAQRQADHILLARYAPSGVVVNERLEVVQFRGRTGDFLEPPPGQPQMNVLRMAREGLVGPLREALEAAQADFVTVRRQGVPIKEGAQTRAINLEVTPLANATTRTEHYFLVVFEEPARREDAEGGSLPTSPERRPPAAHGQPDEEAARLRTELAAARDYLQAATAEHQDTVEELGATNEELVAANEELQSTNEELQSAQEELQSTNEELTTLNDELHNTNRNLDLVASDLANVFESVQIPLIIVDHALRIRRFTPKFQEISSLTPSDVGRSIDDVKLKVRVDDLLERIRATIDTNTAKECEVQGLDGRWFRLNIRPYRTADDRLDGAVLSFVDVDALKRTLQTAEHARDYAQAIVETVPLSLVVLDEHLRIVSANPTFQRLFAADLEASEHAELFALAEGALNEPALRKATERCLAARAPFQDLEVHCSFPNIGPLELVIAGRPIYDASGELKLLLALEDVTARRLLEESEKRLRTQAEQANHAKDLFLAMLSHELRTPLAAILISSQLLQKAATADPKIRRTCATIERAAASQAKLIDDLLDISRIVSGKLMLDLQAVDLGSVVEGAVDEARSLAEAKGVGLELALHGALRPMHGDPARLRQVVANLLTNAIKFTPVGGKISVSLEAVDDKAQLTVSDTGVGLRADLIPQIFHNFVQAESAMTRAHGGLGLGLAITRHIVNVHGGEVRAESAGEGKGASFIVTLPLGVQDGTAVPATRNTVAQSISGVRVLLIEDDDDMRDATALMLEEQGAEVRSARSAAQGLAALETFTPQVILCDIAMSGEDGYAFIRKLRGGSRGRDIPAAAVTALAAEEDRRHALESGFQMHLAKPVDADRLATAVATLAACPQRDAKRV